MKVWKQMAVLLLASALALTGCAQSEQTEASGGAALTSEVLDAPYAGALDAAGQLALGTLMLEETDEVVNADQAGDLLPLWQALQSGAVQGDAETQAVLRQIEVAMTPEQLAAIAAMQPTEDDLVAWMEERGLVPAANGGGPPTGAERPSAGSGRGGDASPEMATRQAERANMSDEEREATRAELKAGGAVPEGAPLGQGGAAYAWRAVLGPLVEVLSQRAGGEARSPGVLPPTAQGPAVLPPETQLALGTFGLEGPPRPITPTETPTPAPAATATPAPAPAAVAEVAPEAIAPAGVTTGSSAEVTTFEGSIDRLTRFEDPSPGPPFTILVSSVTASEDVYRITGLVRNDGSETYEAIGVIGTFYTIRELTDSPSRGPRDQGGDDADDDEAKEGMFANGPVQAQMGCQFLEPGQSCPFSLEIYPMDYVAYGLHPEGQPVAFFGWHEEAPVTLTGVSARNDGVGYVRITGQVVNENDYPLKSVTVTGTLIDGAGQIVGMETTTVVGEAAPGESRSFDLRVPVQAYAHYDVSAQAARY